jgi:Co/Zn/Cd efflux system component
MGLVADSLDMLADAFVYGLSLFAVGAAVSRKKRVCFDLWIFPDSISCHWLY